MKRRKKRWCLAISVICLTTLFYSGRMALAEDVSSQGITYDEQRVSTEETLNSIYDSIPLDDVEEVLESMKGEKIEFSIKEYVEGVMNGTGELSLEGIGEYAKSYVVKQFEANWETFIRLILCGVLSGIFLNFSTGMHEKQMGETGFHIIYFLVVSIMVTGFFGIIEVAGKVLEDVLRFMSALIPSFSIALTWSSGSGTSMVFYQAALAAIGVAENLLIKVFVPLVQVYFFVNILNPIADGKFTGFAQLIRSAIRTGTKIMLTVMIGHQGIQGLIMPAMERVKRSAMFQTASSVPGVGNLFGGISDTIIGTGVLIKSAIGVGGLIAICIICITPLLKLGTFTIVYRGVTAFAQPVTDKRIVALFKGTAESGKLLLHIVCMTAIMFLVTLTIIIAATNHVG